MPQCSFHPGVETEVRCTECGRYICPKDMVETPVGYKCRVCAKPAPSQYRVVKPQQLLRTIVVGGAVGVLGGVIVSAVPLGIFSGLLWGLATAEACRRASGGHREWAVGIVAIVAIVLGWLIAPFVVERGAGVLTVIVAVVVTLVDLALLEFR